MPLNFRELYLSRVSSNGLGIVGAVLGAIFALLALSVAAVFGLLVAGGMLVYRGLLGKPRAKPEIQPGTGASGDVIEGEYHEIRRR